MKKHKDIIIPKTINSDNHHPLCQWYINELETKLRKHCEDFYDVDNILDCIEIPEVNDINEGDIEKLKIERAKVYYFRWINGNEISKNNMLRDKTGFTWVGGIEKRKTELKTNEANLRFVKFKIEYLGIKNALRKREISDLESEQQGSERLTCIKKKK